MTLTEQMITDGWVAHDGGNKPETLSGSPAIMFGDGKQIPAGKRPADYWLVGYWTHHFSPREQIIAYRPEPLHD